MTTFYCHSAYLASGWQDNVRITVNELGTITDIALAQSADVGDRHISQPVIPAIANCHSHAFQRAFAGLSERSANANDSFWSWRQLMYQFLAHLSPHDCGVIARQLYVEMLKAGYNAVGEFHYLHHDLSGKAYDNPTEMADQVIQAASDVGIKMTMLPVFYQYAGFGKQQASELQQRFIMQPDDYLQMVENLLSRKQAHQVNIGIAPHSLRAADISDINRFTKELNGIEHIHIHIAEQLPEVEQSLNYSGLRPVEYLYEHVAVDNRWSLIHATHLQTNEIAAIRDSGAVIGICPTTEASLGDGILGNDVFSGVPPIPWAIGSDSHISVNAAEELRWLEYTQRLLTHRRVNITNRQSNSNGNALWDSAVMGGARSIGHGGPIAVGSQADWCVLDESHSSLSSLPNAYLLDALVFSNREGNAITDVFINGQQVIAAGKHPQEEQILADFQQLMKRLSSVL